MAATGDGIGRLRVGGGHAFTPDAGFWASAAGARAAGSDLYLSAFTGRPEAPDGIVRGANGFQSMTLQTRAWWHDLTFQASFNDREKRIPSGAYETILGDQRAHSDDTRGFAELRFEPQLSERLQLSTRASLDLYAFEGAYPYADPATNVQRDTWNGLWVDGEARLRAQVIDSVALTVGGAARQALQAELRTRNASGTALDLDAKTSVFSGYGVADYAPIRRLAFSFGARVDHFTSIDGNAFSPRLATLIRPSETGVLKLIAGQAFRAPSPYELRYEDGQTQIAPGNLVPETVRTLEAEYTYHPAPEWGLTGDVFFNQIAHLISLDERTVISAGMPDQTSLQYRNLDEKAMTLGAELEVRRAWQAGGMFAATYTWQRTHVGEFDLVKATEISNSPEHVFGLKHAVPVGRSGATFANRLRVESRRRAEDGAFTRAATLWDVTLTGDLPVAHLTYGFGLRNVLGQIVEHPVSDELAPVTTVPQAGRTVFLSLTATN